MARMLSRGLIAAAVLMFATGATSLELSAHDVASMDGTTMLAQMERDEILMTAVREGAVEKVATLLAAYQREHRELPVDEYKRTLLHIAAVGDSESVLQVLLAAGISPNVRASSGATPLHHAAGANRPRMVMLLLAAGADINARTVHGLTPLHMSEGTTQILLDAGAIPDARDDSGQTAMFQLGPDIAALRKAGLDVNERNKFGWTPLHVAAFKGNVEHATALLDNGAEIEALTSAEFVMRGDAAWGSQERTIPAGYTALDIATNEHNEVKWVTGRNRPMIEMLRARGAKRPFLGIRFLSW
jgi:hypothetical protein